MQQNEQLLVSYKETGDSGKFECAEFKSEFENFVLPTILKEKEMKYLCANNILL
jgi:hypothetical protein